jgi:hypothetical protein
MRAEHEPDMEHASNFQVSRKIELSQQFILLVHWQGTLA